MLACFSAVWVMVVMAVLRVELMSLSMLVTEFCTCDRLLSSFLSLASVTAEKLTDSTATVQRQAIAAVFHFLSIGVPPCSSFPLVFYIRLFLFLVWMLSVYLILTFIASCICLP